MTKCTCPPTSPFLWRVGHAEMDTTLMNRFAVRSGISTRNVNTQRKNGKEPMSMALLSKKAIAHTMNPKAEFLQPTTGKQE